MQFQYWLEVLGTLAQALSDFLSIQRELHENTSSQIAWETVKTSSQIVCMQNSVAISSIQIYIWMNVEVKDRVCQLLLLALNAIGHNSFQCLTNWNL